MDQPVGCAKAQRSTAPPPLEQGVLCMVGTAPSESVQLDQCCADGTAHSVVGKGKWDGVRIIELAGLLDSWMRMRWVHSGYFPPSQVELIIVDEHSASKVYRRKGSYCEGGLRWSHNRPSSRSRLALSGSLANRG